jgi:hypothetical protein
MSENRLINAENNEKELSSLAKPENISANDSKSLPTVLKEKIASTIEKITAEKVMYVLSELANTGEIVQEVKRFINKETTYIARIPKKLKEDMQMGLLDFMHDKKTGENLGMLVDSRHKTRGFLRIDEARSINISESLANIALQQQLVQMTEVLNDVRSRVIALQEGHDNDLFGSIKGMHDQLLQMRDKRPEIQKLLAIQAITVLNTNRGRIEMSLLSALEDMEIVPETDWAVLRRIALDKDFLSNTVDKYNRIEELFSYYLAATQLLGYLYAFLDESSSYSDIFKPSKELVENANLQKLIAAEKLYEESIGETWYKNPDNYLLKIGRAADSLFIEDSDFLEVEISGEKLLEAIENEHEAVDKNREE